MDNDDTVVCNDIRKMHQSQNYFNNKKYKIIDEDNWKEIYIWAVLKSNSYHGEKVYTYVSPRKYNVRDKNSFDFKSSSNQEYLR